MTIGGHHKVAMSRSGERVRIAALHRQLLTLLVTRAAVTPPPKVIPMSEDITSPPTGDAPDVHEALRIFAQALVNRTGVRVDRVSFNWRTVSTVSHMHALLESVELQTTTLRDPSWPV